MRVARVLAWCAPLLVACGGTTLVVLPPHAGPREDDVRREIFQYIDRHEGHWQGCNGMPNPDSGPLEVLRVSTRSPTELEYEYRFVHGPSCTVHVEAHGSARVRADGSLWIGRPHRTSRRGPPEPQ